MLCLILHLLPLFLYSFVHFLFSFSRIYVPCEPGPGLCPQHLACSLWAGIRERVEQLGGAGGGQLGGTKRTGKVGGMYAVKEENEHPFLNHLNKSECRLCLKRAASRSSSVIPWKITRLGIGHWHLKSRVFDSLVVQPVFPKGPVLLWGSISSPPGRTGPLARWSLVPGEGAPPWQCRPCGHLPVLFPSSWQIRERKRMWGLGGGGGGRPDHLVHSHLLQMGKWDWCLERVKDLPKDT